MVRGFRDWRQNKNAIWNRKESTFGRKTFASRLKNIVGAPSRSGGTSHYRGLDLEDDPLYKDWMGGRTGSVSIKMATITSDASARNATRRRRRVVMELDCEV